LLPGQFAIHTNANFFEHVQANYHRMIVIYPHKVLSMKNQLFLWIGLEMEPTFKELSLGVGTAYDVTPTAVKLMGNISSIISSTLAMRLSKRCKKSVFVSFNLPEDNHDLVTKVEERLLEEIKLTPQFF
jgi:hypothetical protein